MGTKLAIIRIIPYAIYINTLRLDLKCKSKSQNNKNVGSECRRIFFFLIWGCFSRAKQDRNPRNHQGKEKVFDQIWTLGTGLE